MENLKLEVIKQGIRFRGEAVRFANDRKLSSALVWGVISQNRDLIEYHDDLREKLRAALHENQILSSQLDNLRHGMAGVLPLPSETEWRDFDQTSLSNMARMGLLDSYITVCDDGEYANRTPQDMDQDLEIAVDTLSRIPPLTDAERLHIAKVCESA